MNLCENPAWQPSDLGRPLPDSPFAVSVCMPRWQDVIGYEEKDPETMRALQLGYPRFLLHPFVEELKQKLSADLGRGVFPFPTPRVARHALAYLERRGGRGELAPHDLGLVATENESLLLEFWQHAGEIVSARQAKALLEGRSPAISGAKVALKERIASLAGANPADVYLFPSGMAAMFTAQRLLNPGPTLQLGFPYIDALKLQQRWGEQSTLVEDEQRLDRVQSALSSNKFSGIFCEVPGNPLLGTLDLAALNELRAETPLIVDDTVSTFYNLDLLPHCDLLWSSLTKFFSGTGDVMGGSLILNPDSPHYSLFKDRIQNSYEDLLFEEDAQTLESNSRDFRKRMNQINRTTLALCEYLRPRVKKLFYTDKSAEYRVLMKADGGFGGLFSILVEDAKAFYDNLQISKGPSLGANFSLASPYTLLAHYHELDWAESCGVSRELIRVSVGLEDTEDLIARFSSL